MTAALGLAAPGEVVLVIYEKWAPMRAFLDGLGAVPAGNRPVAPVSPAVRSTPQLARNLLASAPGVAGSVTDHGHP
ncbi:hypothetical protein [Actinoplanes octamycinicus]|uniref:hypothetical protein n=1 Tax=Actinoplanes octamycinicus TaxID=135948 RepID=UPI0031E65DA6